MGCVYCEMISGKLEVPIVYRNHELIITETPIRSCYRLVFARHGDPGDEARRHAGGIIETLIDVVKSQRCLEGDHERWLIDGQWK